VLCQGRVIRSKDVQEKEAQGKEAAEATPGLLAASIVDYKFIH